LMAGPSASLEGRPTIETGVNSGRGGVRKSMAQSPTAAILQFAMVRQDKPGASSG